VVAVLDSGIDVEHEDLADKLWTNLLETAGNGSDDDRNGCVDDFHGCSLVTPDKADPACNMQANAGIRDDNGHGTFVSGIIGARANNSLGLAGAAPNVLLMPVKILDCLGGGTAADAAQGLLYAARMGARVANLSFGADGESLTLAAAIREAHFKYGMVIVTATGNEGRPTVSFPARLPEAIAVASSGMPEDPNVRSSFSDWGPQVAVAAPGLNIISTVPPEFCNVTWLCVQNGPYALASGTSFAAPLVSALAALVVSHTPNLSPEAVQDIIAASAEPLPDGAFPNWDGAGRIRMRDALAIPRFYLGVPGITSE
jgi:subtilisin family serine protease